MVANTILQRILVNSIKTSKARSRKYFNFIRIIFVPSVNKETRLNVQKMRSFIQ